MRVLWAGKGRQSLARQAGLSRLRRKVLHFVDEVLVRSIHLSFVSEHNAVNVALHT